jgi:mono/diheme cytochrome c family protein
VTANRQASALEETVATRAWRFLIPARARSTTNPVTPSAEVLRGALEHWADHCATCHGNNGDGSTPIGRHVFPPAPEMRAARTQNLTDGELFYAIEQGIPWTACPRGAPAPRGEQESAALVHFIRRLPQLAGRDQDMERFNRRAADEQRGGD